MYKCVIWGMGDGYERIINQIKFEELKGNIIIEALVSKSGSFVGNAFDGIPIIQSNELSSELVDYVIITSYLYYKEIFNEAVSLGIQEDKIINGMVFNNPLFDFRLYAELLKNRITIISDDCWGGYIYHNLYMSFFSPFVNIFIQRNQYVRLIQNIRYYLQQPLIKEREASVRGNLCAMGSLGEGEDKVCLELVHSVSFNEAKTIWDRRVRRINMDNLFIKMGLDASDEHCYEYLEIFDRIPEKKVCFFSGEQNYKNVLYLERFELFVRDGNRMDTIKYHDYVRKMPWLLKSINLLKMLNGEECFLRETNICGGGISELSCYCDTYRLAC